MDVQIWTEKYRPRTLSEVIGQKHVVERLQAWVKEGSIPNMLFSGSAGVGKTTTALALAKDLYGAHWRENFSEYNASDERGIDVVRGKIKDFARTMPLGANLKIVFLDESDALTPEAQQALRRTMERYASSCRFILSCNYSSRLIEPIQSRCAVFRFRNLPEEHVIEYLNRVVKGQGLKASEDGLKAIYELSGGDLRKSTNLLQAASVMGGITRDVVFEVASQARPQDIREMVQLALAGKFIEARKKLYELLITQGLSGSDIVRAIHREIFSLDIMDEKKIQMVEKTGEYEFRLNQGSSEEIQIEALLAQFMRIGK